MRIHVCPAVVVACACLLAAACASPTVTPAPAAPTDSAAPPALSATPPEDTPTGSASGASVPPVTAPPPTPVGSTADGPPCGPPDLALDVTGLGATGSVVLVIKATNGGATPCSLAGPPASIALRAGGGSLPLTYEPRPDPWPGDSPGKVAPPVVLQPGERATARAIWRNWCLGPADVSTVWVGLTGEAIDTSPNPAITPPRCDNKTATSSVAGFPFEADPPGG